MKTGEIIQGLRACAASDDVGIMGRLGDGNLVKKSLGCAYLVDDSSGVTKKFGDPSCAYWDIFKHITYEPTLGQVHFDGVAEDDCGEMVVPYSKVMDSGKGVCLEKAIAFQLAMQDHMPCFLVSGGLSLSKDDFTDFHAYNIVDGPKRGLQLVDVENPHFKEEGGSSRITGRYVVPILGVDKGEFVLTDEASDGRTYNV